MKRLRDWRHLKAVGLTYMEVGIREMFCHSERLPDDTNANGKGSVPVTGRPALQSGGKRVIEYKAKWRSSE